MLLLNFENLGIEGNNEVDDDELAQITNKLFVPDRIVTLAAEKKYPEKNATQKITMILMTMVTKKRPKTCRSLFLKEKNNGSDKTYRLAAKLAFFAK